MDQASGKVHGQKFKNCINFLCSVMNCKVSKGFVKLFLNTVDEFLGVTKVLVGKITYQGMINNASDVVTTKLSFLTTARGLVAFTLFKFEGSQGCAFR